MNNKAPLERSGGVSFFGILISDRARVARRTCVSSYAQLCDPPEAQLRWGLKPSIESSLIQNPLPVEAVDSPAELSLRFRIQI